MVQEKATDRQERLKKFLEAVEAAQKLQDDILKYGLDAAYLYVEDVDGDWLEKWGEDDEETEKASADHPVVDDSAVESVTAFLKSDDPVAVRIRERLGGQSLFEISAELEKCRSIPQEDDQQLWAVKKVLAGGVTTNGNNRDSSNENDEIELQDLVKDLLKKLAEIWEK